MCFVSDTAKAFQVKWHDVGRAARIQVLTQVCFLHNPQTQGVYSLTMWEVCIINIFFQEQSREDILLLIQENFKIFKILLNTIQILFKIDTFF